jgi:hypothetical protein
VAEVIGATNVGTLVGQKRHIPGKRPEGFGEFSGGSGSLRTAPRLTVLAMSERLAEDCRERVPGCLPSRSWWKRRSRYREEASGSFFEPDTVDQAAPAAPRFPPYVDGKGRVRFVKGAIVFAIRL